MRYSLVRGFALLLSFPVLASCSVGRAPTGPESQSNALVRLVLTPQRVTVGMGQVVEFTVLGMTASGDTADIAVTWSAMKGTVTDETDPRNKGKGKKKGHYKNDTVGPDTVIVTDTTGVADTTEVTVTDVAVASLEVRPTSAVIESGGTVQLAATVRDSAGNELPERPVLWSSDVPATITATSEGKNGTASITVTDAPSSGGVFPVPATIASDCSADVASDLESFIAQVPDSSIVTFTTDACYRAERFIKVEDRHGLTFDGNGATIKRTELSPPELSYPTPNPHLWFVGGSNLIIKNLKIRGTNTVNDVAWEGFGSYKADYEFEAAVRLNQSAQGDLAGVYIDGLDVDAVWGDGVQIQFVTDVTIVNSVLDRVGRQGLGVGDVEGLLVDNLTILHGRRGGIDLEPAASNWVITNVEVRNSDIMTWLLPFPSGGRGDVSNVWLHHNTLRPDRAPQIVVRPSDGTRRRNWIIEDNVSMSGIGSPQPVYRFDNVENVVMRRNYARVSLNQSGIAVGFYDSTTGTVECNHFEDAQTIVATDGTAVFTESNNSKTATPPTCS
jgi:hypothetical protein